MGKGGGSSHTPVEAPDNLKSGQVLTVVDALCEGPIEGPVDGLKSVLINKTPVLDSDGNRRYENSGDKNHKRRTES